MKKIITLIAAVIISETISAQAPEIVSEIITAAISVIIFFMLEIFFA